MKFFMCDHCKNIITFIENKGVPVMCCGEKMKELVPGAVDAAVEKHVPVISVNGLIATVEVSSVEHPMMEAHYIGWIALLTNKGCQVKYLDSAGKPKADFALVEGEAVVSAYEYCNLHGLWKADA